MRLVRPAKTQISLRIRAVWSESSLIACAFNSLQAIQRGINKNLCHTVWMYRLIWVFAGRTDLTKLISVLDVSFAHTIPNRPRHILSYATMPCQILFYADSNIYGWSKATRRRPWLACSNEQGSDQPEWAHALISSRERTSPWSACSSAQGPDQPAQMHNSLISLIERSRLRSASWHTQVPYQPARMYILIKACIVRVWHNDPFLMIIYILFIRLRHVHL